MCRIWTGPRSKLAGRVRDRRWRGLHGVRESLASECAGVLVTYELGVVLPGCEYTSPPSVRASERRTQRPFCRPTLNSIASRIDGVRERRPGHFTQMTQALPHSGIVDACLEDRSTSPRVAPRCITRSIGCEKTLKLPGQALNPERPAPRTPPIERSKASKS